MLSTRRITLCNMALVYIFTGIIIIITITFMQGIYNYIPQTNHVSSLYSVAVVLYLQFVLYVMLFCKLNMFCSTFHRMCAVPNTAVFVFPQFRAYLICCSGIVWVTLWWFQSPLLLPVYYYYYSVFAVDGVYYCNFDTSLINASLLTIYLLLHTRRSCGYFSN